MIISIIASGSNGNCCLVENKETSILIDAGKSGIEIERRMASLDKSIEDVDAVLVTHEHSDHISGAGVLSRRFNLPLYMLEDVYASAKNWLGKIIHKTFDIKSKFKIKSFNIQPVKTSHDVASCGFVIGDFGLFTDTGIITPEIEKVIPSLKTILLESNHDIQMLKDGPYPAFLKRRVLSDRGHLSNEIASKLIQEKGINLELALLGHLSGVNNTPEVAAKTFKSLVSRNIEYKICSREKLTGSWEIG
ncbi:MBL fold metallo-hydrolase [Spirochaetota bacterium]